MHHFKAFDTINLQYEIRFFDLRQFCGYVLALKYVFCLPRGTLQIRIRFVRQRSDPTLEQTNMFSVKMMIGR